MTTISHGRHRRAGGRGIAMMWVAGAAAATVVSLGVTGTLSSWTSAVVTNSTNTVATANAVILKETGPGATPVTCQSSDGGVANTYTCDTINKYGGTGTPLLPGSSQSVTVTMSNVGTAAGSLTLKAAGCTPTGGITTGSTDACGIVQVKAECPAGTVKYPASGTATLTNFAAAAATTVSTSLAKDASISCTFTVTLPATASPTYAGQTLTQALTWTLTAT